MSSIAEVPNTRPTRPVKSTRAESFQCDSQWQSVVFEHACKVGCKGRAKPLTRDEARRIAAHVAKLVVIGGPSSAHSAGHPEDDEMRKRKIDDEAGQNGGRLSH